MYSIEMETDFDNILDISELDKNRTKLANASKGLSSKLETYHQQLSTIAAFAPQYDSKTGTKANGYRTFIKVRFHLQFFPISTVVCIVGLIY